MNFQSVAFLHFKIGNLGGDRVDSSMPQPISINNFPRVIT